MGKKRTNYRRNKKKKNRPKKSLSLDMHKFRLTGIYELLTGAFGGGDTGLVQAAIHINSTTQHYQDAPSTTTSLPLDQSGQILPLFDQYRVDYIKVTYTPRVTEFEAGNMADGVTAGLINNVPIYISLDIDADGPASGATALVRKSNTKVRNMCKKWTVKYKVPKTISGGSHLKRAGGFRDMDFDGANAQEEGCIQMSTRFPYTFVDSNGNSIPVPNGFKLGEILVETYVIYKNRR